MLVFFLDYYVFDVKDVLLPLSPIFATHVNCLSAKLWQDRLGHLSNKCLDALRSLIHCNEKLSSHDPCCICPLAKQKQLSFVSHNNRSPCSFDLIHCDIWGPFHTPSHTGHRFFLTLVDDYSRFTWVYLLKTKFEVSYVIPQFFNMVHT